MKKNHHLIVFILLFTGFSINGNAETIEGVIKGANCHINHTLCAETSSDPHLVLERDFILITDGGYYFLPNLPRNSKLEAYNLPVRVIGNISGKIVNVDSLSIKQDQKDIVIWDYAEINEELYES